MEIILAVSKEKNLEKLDKLTNDPAFIVSILKNMGYKKLPNNFQLKIGIMTSKKDEKDKN